jgi:hypothetical protein
MRADRPWYKPEMLTDFGGGPQLTDRHGLPVDVDEPGILERCRGDPLLLLILPDFCYKQALFSIEILLI